MKTTFVWGLRSFVVLLLLVFGCTSPQEEVIELVRFPADTLDGVISKSEVELDKTVSSDGQGALKIVANGPVTVSLFETGDLDVEKARLVYKARLRTENLQGQAYLEMLCSFPGKGEFFSRALQSPASGTMDWFTQETPFFLQAGENPDNVKLNLVITGKGTVWIDDMHLVKGPLQ